MQESAEEAVAEANEADVEEAGDSSAETPDLETSDADAMDTGAQQEESLPDATEEPTSEPGEALDAGMDPSADSDAVLPDLAEPDSAFPLWSLVVDNLLDWIPVITLLVGAYFVWRYLRGERRNLRLAPSGDTTRYALASTVLLGSGHRRRILAENRHICRARAPELGLDRSLLVAACASYERQHVLFAWAAVAGIVVSFIGLPLALVPASIALGKQWYDRFVLAARYRKDRFSIEAERQRFGTGEDPGPENVVCYGTVNPFVGLGEWVGSWSVPINTAIPRSGRTDPPEKVTLAEIHEAIAASLAQLAVRNMSSRDVMFVSGTEVSDFRELLQERYCRPANRAPDEMLARLVANPDYRARVYHWISVNEWDGDLVYSYLYRCEKRGEALFFEATQLVLSPVAGTYREVDDLPRTSLAGAIVWLIGALLKLPFVLLGAIFTALASVRDVWDRLLGTEARRQRREANNSAAYNYGALTSERSKMATQQSHVYFQLIDQNLIAQMLNHQILTTLIRLCTEKGIDTSMIESQALTVVNNSTFVNKGSVVTNSQVVGSISGSGAKIGIQRTGAEKTA